MSDSNYAPIALFVYNRPDHTQKTLEALLTCPEYQDSPLYVFCDGSKADVDENVSAVRTVVKELVGHRAVIVESTNNKGLANSIIAGVTRLCHEFGRVIVLEDDLLVSSDFLGYMNDALNLYETNEAVMQVSGYMFAVQELARTKEAVFLPFTSSWGWATWSRSWDAFDLEAKGWEQLKTNREMRLQFNLDNSYDYYSMFVKQMTGKIDSWAIRWYWSVFKRDGLVLYPPYTLVINIGFDGSGTHGWRTAKIANDNRSDQTVEMKKIVFPTQPSIHDTAFNEVKSVLRQTGYGFLSKIVKVVLSKFR